MTDSSDSPCFVYLIGAMGLHGYRTYVGWTTDLDRRLQQHNSGNGARATRGWHWSLLYAERYSSKSQAMSREWSLKKDRSFRQRIKDLAIPGNSSVSRYPDGI
jgi:putative endonuclease